MVSELSQRYQLALSTMIAAARFCRPQYSSVRLPSLLCRKSASPNTLTVKMAAMSTTPSKPVALLLGDTFPDIEAETTQVQREVMLLFFFGSGRGEVG